MSNSLSRFLIPLVLLIGLFYASTFIVDQTQYAIQIRLGKPIQTYLEPGLYFKVPFISRIFYVDNRLLTYDADPGSIITKDKKEMVVDNYSRWKVIEPLKFYETVRNVTGAQARLDDIIYSQLREELGQHTLIEIVSGNRREIMGKIEENAKKGALSFGISIEDVRIKRADLPDANSLSVYGRMEAERRQEANRYRSEGEEKALEIRSQADRERVELLAQAQKTAEEIKGEADAKALKTYADAYRQDEEFFEFLRSHEAYRNSLTKDSTLILDAERPFFKHFQ